MRVSTGTRLRSAVCDTQVVVVKPSTYDVEITCGGEPMVLVDSPEFAKGELQEGHEGGSLLGKRYSDEESGVELLVTSAGAGSLAVAGAPLEIKRAKPLPSSD